MKKLKSFVAVACSLVLLYLSTVPVFASTQSPYDFLLSCGYSEEFLDALSDEMILKMYNAIGDSEVVDIEESVFQLDEEGVLSLVTPYGTINDSSLTITIDAATINRNGTNEIGLCMYTAVWEWAVDKPAIRYKDAIAINWESNIFCLDEFYAQDTKRAIGEANPTIVKEYTNPAEAVQGGIGHFCQLKLFSEYVGGAVLLLLAPTEAMYNPNSSKSNRTNIHFNYVHNRNPLGISLSFSVEVAGVSINPTSMSDSTARYTPFYFSR